MSEIMLDSVNLLAPLLNQFILTGHESEYFCA
jgi:hypothetical protein